MTSLFITYNLFFIRGCMYNSLRPLNRISETFLRLHSLFHRTHLRTVALDRERVNDRKSLWLQSPPSGKYCGEVMELIIFLKTNPPHYEQEKPISHLAAERHSGFTLSPKQQKSPKVNGKFQSVVKKSTHKPTSVR